MEVALLSKWIVLPTVPELRPRYADADSADAPGPFGARRIVNLTPHDAYELRLPGSNQDSPDPESG